MAAGAGLPPGLDEAIQARLRERRADEIIRVRQQGHGRTIISCEMNGWRIVGVGRRFFQGREWVFFTDFLVHYMVEVLGRDWCADSARSGLPHPVPSWLARFQSDMEARAAGGVALPDVGYMTAMFQLAYSLYLLEHHDQLPKILLKRLRIPSQFRPALYETIVASAFALAGCKIEGAEMRATNPTGAGPNPSPEFYATAKSGKRYAVEAKCKDSWRAPCDVTDAAFQAELKTWVRRRLSKASAKALANPIYWFESSFAAAFDEPSWRLIRRWVREAIDDAEAVLGKKADPPAPAYVFVTHNPQLVDDDFRAPRLSAVLEPFLMDDFRVGRDIELEAGFAIKDRHRDVTWVLECLTAVQRVPATFDGSVPELTEPDGKPMTGLRIGSRIDVKASDGRQVTGVLVDIASGGADAHVVIRSAAGEQIITAVPLTSGEQRAVQTYGDAVFGKPEKKRALIKSTFDWYDWFLEVYADYDREALLRQVSWHPAVATYSALSLANLRVRVARELAKATHRPSSASPQLEHVPIEPSLGLPDAGLR